MTLKDLLKIIEEEDIQEIELEDYNVNTMYFLSDFDIADIEEDKIRLQLTTKI